ncbi:TPA: DUF1642 domain-containing protein [Listeria monocytogenes]|uniref:DUF1642 domain-containing protein n=2 Tax=Listeria monocytogenes TaxID=1639 RepID=UPI0010BB8DE1|nr:DUF1642 domain-containing protein [Listeria monocytogenes]EAC3828936.1 DUF1642 domain-containing protein [Listeria monocytogenes]EAC5886669.1 DUF1642 domain-containing protein [Listeria monocytogenes]EAE2992630.1 DUF1642 domain-containing protein [Listeria monocytogenes]EAE4903895.1 DUF1642 domain-containing protein [Listeria monocytogenes]EAG7211031.1 DUF1642 domain-containing protein [Listeria monocytogenes]
MRFKKGDKVEFIYGGTLTQGVVNEIRATNHDISYQIVYFGGEKKIWFAERELLSPAPVLKVPQFVADWISRRRQEGYNLIWSISYENNDMPDEMYEWLTSTADNQELFARAWLDGYEELRQKYNMDMTFRNFNINNALAGKTEVIYDFDNSGFVYFESDRKILKEDFKEITDVEYIKRNLECAIWKKEREGK